MTKTLTWFDLSKLDAGDRVIFTSDWDLFPITLIPAGTAATVTENGLNEIWRAMSVKPDDLQLRKELDAWDGVIDLSPKSPAWDGEDMNEHNWEQTLSPLAKLDPQDELELDRQRVVDLISSCEADLGRKLSRGERCDLLMDNTQWDSHYIYDLVDSIASADARANTTRRFTLNSEPCDLLEFLAINLSPDVEPLTYDEIRSIFALAPGETLLLGGGAAETFILRREA